MGRVLGISWSACWAVLSIPGRWERISIRGDIGLRLIRDYRDEQAVGKRGGGRGVRGGFHTGCTIHIEDFSF